jgi:catechol 2,3-dioxygenase-like lactoylglutathione lyase family enzyme
MLSAFRVGIAIPVGDMARARRFYADVLGFTPVSEREAGLVYTSGGVQFTLVPSDDAGRASYSLMTWYVDDIAAEMAALRARGLVFQDYDFPGLRTVNGVADLDGNRLAWFKDSEGNVQQ